MEFNKYTQEALTRLSREELRRILAEELRKEPTEADDSLVRFLLAELRTRDADPVFTDDDAVLIACEKFQAATETKQQPQKRWYQSWMLKVASILLVLGVLFFALPQSTEAKNMPEILTWWSDSLFQLFNPGSKPNIEEYIYTTDHPGLQQIYDTVTEAGVTVPIVPRNLSSEFTLTELKTLPMQGDATIYARLASTQSEILFTVTIHSEEAMFQHEKKADSVAIWNLAGIKHYVIINNNTCIITWATENAECTITTDCPEDDVYRLIKSIYTSED